MNAPRRKTTNNVQKASLKHGYSGQENKSLHPRNLHNQGYNFTELYKSYPPLTPYIQQNKHGDLSINYGDARAVKTFNAALLQHYYHIENWDIPDNALCPPIPGRVDYIHYVADLINQPEKVNNTIKLLDIGTGANGIYGLLACKVYGWQSVGSDVDSASLANVFSVIKNNPSLHDMFSLRLQEDKHKIFSGIIRAGEYFDVTVCNPPFHSSEEDAIKGSQRKLSNLAKNRGEISVKKQGQSPTLNFGGSASELWCKGGEKMFLKKLIKESHLFSTQCTWFTSLVSKGENVKPSRKLISKLGATDIREFEMKQGNKTTRVLAWTFRTSNRLSGY